jgi:predicted secreted acid phosphatase
MVQRLRQCGTISALGVVLAWCLCGCAVRTARPLPLESAKQAVIRYYESGDYEQDVRKALAPAQKILEKIATADASKAAIVLDIDETALSTYEYQKGMDFGHYGAAWHDWIRKRRATAVMPVLEVYRAARAKGLAAFFVTGRREAFRADTEANLRAAGYEGWADVMMKPDAYSERSVAPFKTRCREQIEGRGYRIVLNLGDQESDLAGGYAEQTILLPNYIYHSP